MARKRKSLGQLLLDWGVINETQLNTALEHAKNTSQRIGEALVELGMAEEEDVTKALATQYDMEYVDLDRKVVLPNATEVIPEEIIKRHLVLPMGQENGRLKVIIHDPLDLELLDLLRFRLNTDIECVLASRSKIKNFIDQFVLPLGGESIDRAVSEIEIQDPDADLGAKEAASTNDEDPDAAPIVKLVTLIINEAIRSRASDIHIEPMADRVRVRYRIDGVCIERDNIPKRMQNSVISRIKIMSGMDIAEKRLPQDGRIKLTHQNQEIDFRVSTVPGYHGESVVLRILRAESANMGIQNLGFEHDDYERFQKIIRRPNGVFLVTGPTGSGKTTTLYAALQELNRPDKKIITAEDPVEYHFTGMNQCQVREEIGLTFARILRAMLRQAPNIILVGEIRDAEVAEVAIQAALTGHLVFSTLHTNDAPSAITRLIDMGVKPFLVASSIQAVMAQRLVRVICPECKQLHTNPDPQCLRLLGIDEQVLRERPIYRGVGCSKCNNTGYHGRTGIFEMMVMNNELREMAFSRSPTNLIRKAARASGMRSLIEDGKIKIFRGTTTPEEVARITQIEGVLVD